MAAYDLPYAQEHLTELFEEACNGEDVIIVRSDARSCQLAAARRRKGRSAGR
jgi:antitoxin (DNA-binding transcriptional repressor) of toxin-antitoxin stability system